MSDVGKAAKVDLSFLEKVQSAPIGRRGGDSDSERGKVRQFFFSQVLDPMVASQKTERPISRIELTDVVVSMRQLALEKDGKTWISIPVGEKLSPGQRWMFLPNQAPDERYRGLRNYLTGLLKARKEFALEKHSSAKHGKLLTFIVLKQVKK